MHKTPIDLRRLLPLVLLTLILLTPSLVSAANSAQPADPEQPIPSERLADIPRASETPAFGYVYTVVAGDDLWQIAIAHGLDMEQLAAENNLEAPYWLQPGDRLWVPAEPAVVHQAAPPVEQQTAQAAAPAATYVVQSGDDVWQIAVAHGLEEEELAAANGLQPPYWIHPGDRLVIPGQAAQEQQAAPAAETAATAEQPAAAPEQPAAAPEQPADPAAANEISAQSTASADLSPGAALILNNMNEKRAAFGLPALSWSGALAQAAQAHAQDLAARGWGGHVGSDGAHLRTRLNRVGYGAVYTSENWANTTGSQQAFDMWWFEPDWGPHRLNILGANYAEIGIGIAQGGWGYFYVADFGSR